MDGDAQALYAMHADEIYWRYDLTVVEAFITYENINQLFRDNGFSGKFDLLRIDIDSNEYWVWKAINSISPVIVTMEYNSVSGAQHAINVPYDSAFYRTKVHYSNLYWGASLNALCILADNKGHTFVGCIENGNKAHFVRKEKACTIPVKSAEEGDVESRLHESHDANSNLTYLRGGQRIDAIKDMQVVDIELGNRTS